MPWVMDCGGGTQGLWKERLRTITPQELAQMLGVFAWLLGELSIREWIQC